MLRRSQVPPAAPPGRPMVSGSKNKERNCFLSCHFPALRRNRSVPRVRRRKARLLRKRMPCRRCKASPSVLTAPPPPPRSLPRPHPPHTLFVPEANLLPVSPSIIHTRHQHSPLALTAAAPACGIDPCGRPAEGRSEGRREPPLVASIAGRRQDNDHTIENGILFHPLKLQLRNKEHDLLSHCCPLIEH